MTVWPVITRELRAEARNPVTYGIRLAGAMILLAVMGAMLLRQRQQFGLGQGFYIFHLLNRLLNLSIWVFVPILTADCISRERREGTLGLLFLTPLRALDISLAKSLTNVLRAMAIWLAVVPIMAIPVLLGGVSGADVLGSALNNGRAMLLALAAGIVASTFSREWNRALLFSIALSLSFALGFFLMQRFWYRLVYARTGWMGSQPSVWMELGNLWTRAITPAAFFGGMGGGRPGGPAPFPWQAVYCFGFAAVVFGLVIWFAAVVMNRKRLEEGPSQRQLWLSQTFCTPVIGRQWLRRKMDRTKNRNPIGWLQQYSWSARLTKWGWCLFLIIAETHLVVASFTAVLEMQRWLANALAVGIAMSAVASFRKERESGALELILVTPLRERQVIWGRVRGIWGQFLPALAVLLVVWVVTENQGWGSFVFRVGNLPATPFPLWLGATAVSVPLIGLYFSTRRMNFVVGIFLTVVVGLVLPRLICWLVAFLFGPSLGPRNPGFPGGFGGITHAGYFFLVTVMSYVPVVIELALGLVAWRLLHRSLAERTFVLR